MVVATAVIFIRLGDKVQSTQGAAAAVVVVEHTFPEAKAGIE